MADILHRYPGDQRDWPTGYLVEDAGRISGFGNGPYGPTVSDAKIQNDLTASMQMLGIKPGPISQETYDKLVSNVLYRAIGPNMDATVQARVEAAIQAKGVYVGKKKSVLTLVAVGLAFYFITK